MFFVSVKFAEGGTTSIKMGEGTHFNLPGVKILLVKNGNYFFETKQISTQKTHARNYSYF